MIDRFKEKMELQKCKSMALAISEVEEIDESIFKALCSVRRDLFVPNGMEHLAYKVEPLPLIGNQWISSPLTVAKMTKALKLKNCDKVLEIGCGSGYQAAILSKIVRAVFTVERVVALSSEAKARFKKLGIDNIHVRSDDGLNGWREYAPYDRILFSASTGEIPQKLFSQLKSDGIIVAPIVKSNTQHITSFNKQGKIIAQESQKCEFVKIVSGIQR
jgi:protein-L-isoaspartate(D-aspartate) O-methyltransferase